MSKKKKLSFTELKNLYLGIRDFQNACPGDTITGLETILGLVIRALSEFTAQCSCDAATHHYLAVRNDILRKPDHVVGMEELQEFDLKNRPCAIHSSGQNDKNREKREKHFIILEFEPVPMDDLPGTATREHINSINLIIK